MIMSLHIYLILLNGGFRYPPFCLAESTVQQTKDKIIIVNIIGICFYKHCNTCEYDNMYSSFISHTY